MTNAELEALPEGPHITTFRPWTEAELRAGATGRGKQRTEFRFIDVIAGWDHDDIVWWTDKRGLTWRFGRWTDGQWYKEPF